MRRRCLRSGLGAVAILACTSYLSSTSGSTPVGAQSVVGNGTGTDTSAAALLTTATPIKHVVVLFQENVSFDHYFATYPNATNPPNEPAFTASPNTPSVNGLSGPLLNHNPNSAQDGGATRTQPAILLVIDDSVFEYHFRESMPRPVKERWSVVVTRYGSSS